MMKRLLTTIKHSMLPACILAMLTATATIAGGTKSTLGCSDAGIASATEDSICYNTTITLSLTGYTGTSIQWQSFDGTTWSDEAGAGATTDSYDVTPLSSTNYRAIVIEAACAPDTSNELQIVVGTIPVPTASNVSRCGPGYVNLSGVGSGTLQWFDSPNATTPIATGNPATVFVPATTTLYVADQTLGSGGANSPILITEMELTTNDNLELQNVSPFPVDVTGWKVAVSDNYTNINQVNTIVQTLSGTLNPGDIINFTDNAAGPNYWGNNILWAAGANPTYTGWAIIIDDQNNIKDFVPLNWDAATIQTMSIVVNGATLTPGTIWTGNGVDISNTAGGISFQRFVNSDNNNNTDFSSAAVSTNATNASLTLPFTGFGCNSPLVPVQVTISTSDDVTINASSTSFCLTGNATLTATSNNSNYAYTWSPASGLSGTTGATVTFTPTGSGNFTYVVIGDDGTCSNVDTVTISVGALTVAGSAATYQDSICLGKNTDLILTGSVGNIQWQSLNGSTWVNETGPGSNAATYNVSPTANTTYRAYISSGSCPPDSSNIIDIAVLSISNPVTTGDSICGSGSVTLLASGPGTLTWYNDPIAGSVVNTGSSYTFNATTTTTYYVDAFAGSLYNIGPLNSGFGNQSSTASNNNYGMAFDVIRPVTIEVVHIYPSQSGSVTINLRQGSAGPVLATYTQNVVAFSGKTPIPVGFSVPVGTGYKLEIASGGPSLTQNTAGATYPYTTANGPLSIVGCYNPNLNTATTAYLWLYDWIVAEGCRSQRIPVTATVNSFPSVPTISQNFNTLTSSAPTGNQWLLNGSIIPGATTQTITITQTGNYTVAVTLNGCTTLSPVFPVLTIGLNEIPAGSIVMYPNPVDENLFISLTDKGQSFSQLRIVDVTGRVVYSKELSGSLKSETIVVNTATLMQGIYLLELKSENSIGRKQFIIEH